MPNFSSNHGIILLALKDRVLSLQPEELSDMEVEVRDDWLHNGEPMKGISIYEAGESSRNGVIGAQDIGYMCGIAFVRSREGASYLENDKLMAWRELVRRDLTDARLSVVVGNRTAPREHVCIINKAGQNLTNEKKFPGWNIRHLSITVWLRELGTS